MKRSAALAPLSRDHQHAFDAALRLRRATPADTRAGVEHFLAFWTAEGRRHFEIEESRLGARAAPARAARARRRPAW